MKPKTLVLMGVAIACGLGASYMTSRLLAERGGDDEPKISVLVAKKMLNIGDTVKVPDEMFQEKKYTRGDEPPGAIDNPEQLKNKVLKRPLRPGDHVTLEDLISPTDDNTMNVTLPGGYRALGVRVNVESAASGWASLPLSRVDLISVVRRADDKATYSQILLENVLVLAADDKMRRGDDGKPMPSQVVTLALKPEDVLRVTLARSLGELSLALRKINAQDRAEKDKLTYEQLKSGESGSNSADLAIETSSKPQEVVASKVETPTAPPQLVTPGTTEKPPVDLPVVEQKQVLTKFVQTVTEGGKTRNVEYWYNQAGELVEPDASVTGSEAHPPRPTDVTDPKKN